MENYGLSDDYAHFLLGWVCAGNTKVFGRERELEQLFQRLHMRLTVSLVKVLTILWLLRCSLDTILVLAVRPAPHMKTLRQKTIGDRRADSEVQRKGYKTLWEEKRAYQLKNYRLEGRVHVGSKVLSRCLLLLYHVFPIAWNRCEKLKTRRNENGWCARNRIKNEAVFLVFSPLILTCAGTVDTVA